jgi:glutathione S-transferase
MEMEQIMVKAPKLTLVSHHLCPYVQRAVIALAEKGVPYERVDIDLADKPEWFKALSPLGKTPVLKIGQEAIFESAVILEYIEETTEPRLHPADPVRRAEHRAWIEYGSTVLSDIWGFYTAPDAGTFEEKRELLGRRFAWLEQRLLASPWFDGEHFSLVDAVFGPVFRYFDAFDRIGAFVILAGKPKIARWRDSLAKRSSVRDAVIGDYQSRLLDFFLTRNSHLSRLMGETAMAA